MTSAAQPAIVVAAHQRPHELQRLLASLSMADIAPETPLIISIDGGAHNQSESKAVADQMDWPWGPFTVVEHDHLGLVEHFHTCGDLTHKYGAIVFLEDDLVVGPAFLSWTIAALNATACDPRIAGISLATPFFDGYQHLPFEPVIDGSDAIFMQVPWYDGMAWTADMWQRFRTHRVSPSTSLHRSFSTLADDEWFPDAVRYLIETSSYYLLPRQAQVTNSGAVGTHFARETSYFQQPLTLRGPAHFRVQPLDEALAIYDDHMELTAQAVKRLVPDLDAFEFTTDMLAVRDLAHVSTGHVLTTRNAKHADRLWGATMHPLIANLAHNVAGDSISLAAVVDVDDSVASRRKARELLMTHADRGRDRSARETLQQLMLKRSVRFRRNG